MQTLGNGPRPTDPQRSTMGPVGETKHSAGAEEKADATRTVFISHTMSSISDSPVQRGDAPRSAEEFIFQKHREYVRKSTYFRWLYYGTRLIAGISAGLVPVAIPIDARVATVLSILVVISIVVETVFDPKERWAAYSRVTDALAIEELKQKGHYKENEARIELIASCEKLLVTKLRPINDVLEAIKSDKSQGQPPRRRG